MAALLHMLKDLFRESYATNCQLENDPVTDEDLATLEDLDGEELIDNLKNLLNELLDFKRNLQASDKTELYKRSEQLEGLLQKLEGDVRQHIRVTTPQLEHQLKLHIDGLNAKQAEVLKNKDHSDQSVEELRQLLKHKDNEIQQLKAALGRIGLTSQLRTEDLSLDRNIGKQHKTKSRQVGVKKHDENFKEGLQKLGPNSHLSSCVELRNQSTERRANSRQRTERKILRKRVNSSQQSVIIEPKPTVGGQSKSSIKKHSRDSSIGRLISQKPTHYRCKSDVELCK